MNKLCTLILTLFCLTSLSAMAADEEDHGAGFWVEFGTASHEHVSWFTGYWDHNFTDSLGVYALVEKESDGYHEFYVGPKVKLTEWLEIGIATGREVIRNEMPNSGRRNAFVSVDTEKVSAYATYENGGSGPWHKMYVLYKATETTSIGMMNETFIGRGPRLEYNITKNVQVWGALLRDHTTKETTSLLAVNFSF